MSMSQGGPQYLGENIVHWRVTRQGVICTRCPEFSIPGWPIDYEPLIVHQIEVHGYARKNLPWTGQLLEPTL